MFPTGALMERVASFQSLLLHVSRVPHKSSPDKLKFYPYLEGPRKETSTMFLKTGHLWEETPIFRALSYPSGSPLKEPSLQVLLTELQQ
jgi:hypothetical protein